MLVAFIVIAIVVWLWVTSPSAEKVCAPQPMQACVEHPTTTRR